MAWHVSNADSGIVWRVSGGWQGSGLGGQGNAGGGPTRLVATAWTLSVFQKEGPSDLLMGQLLV